MTQQTNTVTSDLSALCLWCSSVRARVHNRLLSHAPRAVLAARPHLTRLHTALSLRCVPCGAPALVRSVPGQCHAHSLVVAAVSGIFVFIFFSKFVLFVGLLMTDIGLKMF